MRNILAVCNTPLQIICALNLKNTIYKRDSFDIIISDHMNLSYRYVEAIKQNGLFNEAYYIESFDLCKNAFPGMMNSIFNKIKFYFNRISILKGYIDSRLSINKKYDVFLFNNIDTFSVILYEVLWRRNKQIQAYMFEDGYSSYYAQGIEWKERYDKLKSLKQIIKNTIFRIHPLEANINGQYLYKPEVVEWKAPFKRIKMSEIDVNNKKLVEQFNLLFGYKEEEKYDEPIIFFEESFRREGLDIGDVNIVKKIADIVGKEKILVKPHPRNNINVYAELGFKTVETSTVPWEIVIINHPEYAEKILVSVGSGAIATPYTMFGMKTKSIVLLDLIQADFSNFHQEYFKYMRDRIFGLTPEVFIMPKNENEMIDFFVKWKEKE